MINLKMATGSKDFVILHENLVFAGGFRYLQTFNLQIRLSTEVSKFLSKMWAFIWEFNIRGSKLAFYPLHIE